MEWCGTSADGMVRALCVWNGAGPMCTEWCGTCVYGMVPDLCVWNGAGPLCGMVRGLCVRNTADIHIDTQIFLCILKNPYTHRYPYAYANIHMPTQTSVCIREYPYAHANMPMHTPAPFHTQKSCMILYPGVLHHSIHRGAM